MNEIVNKFLLAGHKFMPEINLRQPGFIYSACRPFTKYKQRIQKFMQTGDPNCIYRNESSGKNDKYEYLTGEDVLLFDQKRVIE